MALFEPEMTARYTNSFRCTEMDKITSFESVSSIFKE